MMMRIKMTKITMSRIIMMMMGMTTIHNDVHYFEVQDIRGLVYQANTCRYLVHRQIHMEDKYTNANAHGAQIRKYTVNKYTRCPHYAHSNHQFTLALLCFT